MQIEQNMIFFQVWFFLVLVACVFTWKFHTFSVSSYKSPRFFLKFSSWQDLILLALCMLTLLQAGIWLRNGADWVWIAVFLVILFFGHWIPRFIFFLRTPEKPENIGHVLLQQRLREGFFDFANSVVSEVMVPINDVFKINETDSVEKILSRDDYRPYSRIPVIRGEKDNVVGVVYAREIMEQCKDLHAPVASFIRDAYFVPEVMELSALLREFQRRRIHMAVVVDEFGVCSGIVTLEDLLETIVGELKDKRNDNEDHVHRIGLRSWILDAMMDLDDFCELIGLDIESETVETLGGFVFEKLGFLPCEGSSIVFENFEFRVLSMKKYRIRKIGVRELSK